MIDLAFTDLVRDTYRPLDGASAPRGVPYVLRRDAGGRLPSPR
jgi:hypothetical protein